MWEGITTGLSTVLVPTNLLLVAGGCFAGTFIGMLPGLGPISAIAPRRWPWRRREMTG